MVPNNSSPAPDNSSSQASPPSQPLDPSLASGMVPSPPTQPEETGFMHSLKQAFFLAPQDKASGVNLHNPMPADVTPEVLNGDKGLAPGLLRGGEKGLAETMAGTSQLLGKAKRAITGESDQTPSDLITGQHHPTGIFGEATASPDEFETHGGQEWTGKAIENVMEFMAGDEALKALTVPQQIQKLAAVSKLIEQHPFVAKLIASATRQGAVGAGQTLAHGGDAGDALKSGLTTAVVSGGLGTLGKVGDVLKGAGSSDAAAEGSKLAESLSGDQPVPAQSELAKNVGDKIQQAETDMHSRYDSGMSSISAAGQDVPVSISNSPLQKTAQDLLGGSGMPDELQSTLKGIVPDKAKVQPLLEELATSPEGKTYSWDQMEATRQGIGKSIRDLPLDSPIRPDLIKLRSGIDETLQQSAQTAGKPELAQQIQSLRSDYASTNQKLTQNAIKTLSSKNPDSIADVLLNKTSVDNVGTLRSLIGPQNMKAVEGGLFDRMLQRSTASGEFNPQTLKRTFYGMKPDVQQAIWGDRVADVKKFVDAAANNPLSKVKGGVMAAGLGYGAWKIATSDDPMSTAKNELVLGLSGLGALHIAPKLLSNPAVLKSVGTVMSMAGKPVTRKAAAMATNELMMSVAAAHAQDTMQQKQ